MAHLTHESCVREGYIFAEMPADYDPALVTSEDCAHDGAIRVLGVEETEAEMER
tara:strand:+ start:1118 stop:1279 length:162 start_codon:yes stop_codon:yes gene_type:complete